MLTNTWNFDQLRIFAIIATWGELEIIDGISCPVFYGIKKLVKIDYFLRYPNRSKQLLQIRSEQLDSDKTILNSFSDGLLSDPEIRSFYGPFDRRYNDVFIWMKAAGRFNYIEGDNNIHKFIITPKGLQYIENEIKGKYEKDYKMYCDKVTILKAMFGEFSGSELENFIKNNDEDLKLMNLGVIIPDREI